MAGLIYLIPAALFLGLLGLAAFLWALRSGQYEDLDGAANRILYDDAPGAPVSGPPPAPAREKRATSRDRSAGR
ncbi:MAG: cbb3-type cytochrome oxidase assembly protein CcoS [Rhodospirillales bacterium]